MQNVESNFIHHSAFIIHHLLAFLVHRVTAAAATEFFELKPVGRGLFILGRHVIAFFALRAL
jgi:hypothetical protein